MDSFHSGMYPPDEEQDGVMVDSCLSQETVRGSSFEMSQQDMPQGMGCTGHYPESYETASDHYDPSNPAYTVTTETSWTGMDPFGSGSLPYEELTLSGPPVSQEVELRGITGGSEIDLDPFLNEMETELSPTSPFRGRNIETSAMMGLTGDDTQPSVSRQPRPVDGLVQSLGRVADFSRNIQSNIECTPNQLRQAILSLTHLTDHANVLLRKHDTSLIAPEPPRSAPSSTESITVTRYKCWDCNSFDTGNRGSFTRHVDSMHYPKCKFFCPVCGAEKSRRDHARDHVSIVHGRQATNEELDANKIDNACPVQCPICRVTLNSWREFQNCYCAHCSYDVPPKPTTASRRGSADRGDGGRGDEFRNSQPVEGTGMRNHAPAQSQSGLLRGTTDRGVYPPSFSGASGLTNQIPRPQALPRLPTNARVTDNTGTALLPANVPRSPQTTRRSIPGDGIYRIDRNYRLGGPNRFTPDQRARTPRGEPDPGCTRCLHRFSSCQHPQCLRQTESSESCHACPHRPRILASIGLYPRPQLTGPPHNNETIDPSLLAPGYQPQPATGQNTQEQLPSWNRQFRDQLQGWRFNNGMGSNFTGTRRRHPRNNRRVLAVTSIDEPIFSEQEVALPSVLDLKAAQQHGALLKMLPMMNPLKTWFSKPLKDLSSVSLSGLDFITQFNKPPSASPQANPSCQCKCACRARARAQLASGGQVEMKFKLHPEYRGTSHLRSRVEVMLKLLKLRSSAAQSKSKREEAKAAMARAFEPVLVDRPYDESDVSDESDTESVFDEDEDDAWSSSSSCPDLTSLVPAEPGSSDCPDISSDDSLLPLDGNEYEGEGDDSILIQFDFDLQSALSKLSKWTGGSSRDIASDMCISDPGRVFEYLTAYILYVIMSLARSRDCGNPRLGN
ncbi:uncharacterized protein N7498_007256 [Penicillium cinerascens]|uniref:C2H2-type domain-containing protein n=1 Tax=Penicillium cinerascens TaxID=70096 RepID=A0A9W9JKT0_9EURO|nr:uncharacterized protein N7498_007256 [Penicillium cinerascens]KAJ5198139.1 hypothetical protein N7498_007256 [Penicillium cinerascens]